MKEKKVNNYFKLYILNHLVQLYNSIMIFIGILDYYLNSITPGMEVDKYNLNNVEVAAIVRF